MQLTDVSWSGGLPELWKAGLEDCVACVTGWVVPFSLPWIPTGMAC